jgi:KTSC domain
MRMQAFVQWGYGTMTRTPVASSTLKSIGYADGILEVEFPNGSVYRYFGVSKETVAALMASESKGQHFVKFIRGRYHCEESTETQP